MNALPAACLIGGGATMLLDLWALSLRRAFGIPFPGYCPLGRWLRHMPGGRFFHASIAAAPGKSWECTAGWIAHYAIGVLFAFAFLVIAPRDWLARPTLWPALLFGLGTVVFPYLILQPAFGLGLAASRSPKPATARLRSLMSHGVFGLCLYVCAVATARVLPFNI